MIKNPVIFDMFFGSEVYEGSASINSASHVLPVAVKDALSIITCASQSLMQSGATADKNGVISIASLTNAIAAAIVTGGATCNISSVSVFKPSVASKDAYAIVTAGSYTAVFAIASRDRAAGAIVGSVTLIAATPVTDRGVSATIESLSAFLAPTARVSRGLEGTVKAIPNLSAASETSSTSFLTAIACNVSVEAIPVS